ncbi:MAG: methionine--tRNA ligase [PVC group bacterium]|nr:methionine--tRNA ligase [PVC group bacterium]
MEKENRFYITTAIDYPSGKPHIGHAYEKIIADVIARWQRKRSREVFFLTGTDEHGQKIERYAANADKSPQEFANEMTEKFLDLCQVLNVSNDDFIRTTQKRHIDVAQTIFKKVFDKGDIYKDTYKGFYCVDCESFYLERDLTDGNCLVHGKKVDWMEEEGYFFRMSKYQQKILDHIKANDDFIWPESRRNEVISRLQEPLRDLNVSRSNFTWGIPLPNDKGQVIYVWFDALINYVSGAGYPDSERFKRFWPAAVHLVGKDILWFHTVVWPAILMAADIELPQSVCVHGFINLKGEKISKSTGSMVDPIELAKKYGTDSLRYFLMREISFGEDGNFSEDALIRRINSDLANDLGNLVHRTLTMIEKYFQGSVPEIKTDKLKCIKAYVLAAGLTEAVDKEISVYNFSQALAKIWEAINAANKLVEETKPWNLSKEGKIDELGVFIFVMSYVIDKVRENIDCFMPQTAVKIVQQFQPGKIKKDKPLFPRIQDDKLN